MLLSVLVVLCQVNEVETLMVLTINRVYLQHFKTYLFEVENDIGRVIREVSLERGNCYEFRLIFNFKIIAVF